MRDSPLSLSVAVTPNARTDRWRLESESVGASRGLVRCNGEDNADFASEGG